VKNTDFYEEKMYCAHRATSSLLYLIQNKKGGSFMLESRFQAKLIKKLKEEYPGCIIMKNDPTYIQGIPDLIILYEGKWASLECKKNAEASHQPNQDYYVDKMNKMSFSSFIFPENEKEVLDKLRHSFNND
jgi:hypothetical protein